MITKSSEKQAAFIKNHKKQRMMITLLRLLVLILFIALWEGASNYQLIDAFIFSSPSRILQTLSEMVINGSIFYHTGITLFEILVSFSLGTFLGVLIAILLWWNHQVSKILEPYLVVLNSLPKTALAPILIVWLGHNIKSIIIIALTVSIVVTILNTLNGFHSVDKDKIKLIYTFGGSKMDVLRKVVIPANYANIISTMKVNIGLSLIGVIIGELLAARAGLGYLIIYGSQVFKMDWVMMSLILLALLATGLYQGIVYLEKKVSRYNM